MGIVTTNRLNTFLSGPTWQDSQWEEAGRLCEEVESTLAAQLMTYITPRPYIERVAILASGLVATTHPVVSVTAIDGAPAPDPLVAPWRIQDGRLRWVQDSAPPFGVPSGSPFTLLDPYSTLYGQVPRVDGVGAVTVDYQAGWGDDPTLRLAILRKLGAIWVNRHDDTVVVRDMDASNPPPLPSEEWSEEELKPLGTYRNLAAWK